MQSAIRGYPRQLRLFAYARLARSGLGRRALDAQRAVRSLQFVGTRYHCELCGWSFRKLLSFGVKVRPNVRCPRCGSLPRHRLLWHYLEHSGLLDQRPLRLLHVAPEESLMRKVASLPGADYVTVDLDSPLAGVHADLCAMPFESGHFDGILCNHVLEHIPDEQGALRELLRVLRPGGWAILLVPLDPKLEQTYEDPAIVDPTERARHFGQFDHVRLYGRDYADRLAKGGFVVSEVSPGESLSREERLRLVLPEHDVIQVCRKPAES